MFEILKKIKNKEAIFLFVVFFLAYLLTQSCSLDDWDSVQFALGLKEFNVAKHQPHPPGFPVYIFLGKIFYFFLKNELLALTALSAFSGAMSLVFFYLLVSEMFNRKIAFASSLILGATPMFWINSVEAMSDMPGILFLLVSTYFIYLYLKYDALKFFYLGSFLSGLSAGLRLHSLFFLLPIIFYVFFAKKTKFPIVLNVLFLFFAGILIWLVPTILITGSRQYLILSWKQFSFRFNSPSTSVLGSDFNVYYLLKRFENFISFFLLAGYGVILSKLYLFSSAVSFVISLGIVISLFFVTSRIKNRKFLFILAGLVPYFLMIFITLPPSNPRYLLPFLFLFSMTFSLIILKFKKMRYAAFLVFLALLFFQSLPLALEIRKNPSPPVQLINYLKENYSPKETVVIVTGSPAKHFSYYKTALPTFSYLPSANIKDLLKNKKIVLVTDASYKDRFKLKQVKVFARNPRIHQKHYTESLYQILEPL